MSDSDSFIEEVNEELRRDRLFAIFRRYGWIAVAVVVLIVGAAAYNEYRKANEQAKAAALGDAVLEAVQLEDAAAREAALDKLDAPAEADPVIELLKAAAALSEEDRERSAEILTALAADSSIPEVYGDLAALKLVLLGADATDADTRAQLLERLIIPGAPYRKLGLELKALDLAAAGDTEGAIAAAQAVLDEPELTREIFSRVGQLIVALGGSTEDIVGTGATQGADGSATDAAPDAGDGN